ncbi:hypothetical protein [Hyphomonas sp.]|uniref:hypothetical protein n=1 Tax=Hyphomonas sp. TaxID=87 RepID=UPI0030FD0418
MLRFISILLVLAGLAVAGIGGAALLEEYRPHETMAMESMPEAVEAMPAPEAAMEIPPEPAAMEAPTEAQMAPAAPGARSSGPTTRSLSSGSSADDTASVASAGDALDTAETFSVEAAGEFDALSDALAETAGVAAAEPRRSHAEVFMESLQTVPVAHETPKSAEYKRAFDVTLAIDATGDDTAVDALPGRGNIVTGEAQVSDRVEARVSGANFEIVPMSPGVQSLSPLTENVWRWSVMPLSAGDHDLVFEIYAIDQDSVVPLRTFRDTVTVQVSGINRAIAFADQANPLFVLLGGLGSAIAGLLGAVKFFGRR